MRNLLIVESAGKIKKLKSILGSDWDVKASIGHIRQLANDGDGSLGFELGTEKILFQRGFANDCRYTPRDDRAKQTALLNRCMIWRSERQILIKIGANL